MTGRIRVDASATWISKPHWNAKTHLQGLPYKGRETRALCGEFGPRYFEIPGPDVTRQRCQPCIWAKAFPKSAYVYVLHGHDDLPIYIGCTRRLYHRLKQHQANPYWAGVSRTTLTGFDDARTAAIAEANAIAEHTPLLNRWPDSPYIPLQGPDYRIPTAVAASP